ncbi:hypothetical protein AgCh_000659 [Apium graveolens]
MARDESDNKTSYPSFVKQTLLQSSPGSRLPRLGHLPTATAAAAQHFHGADEWAGLVFPDLLAFGCWN